MALSGLEIFKLLPKTNCKKCGMPTCLAFAMALAQKKVSLDQCPDASQAARDTLAAAAAPPMRLVTFGAGDAVTKTGQETVLFRHEEKFHSPTVVAVTLPDNLDEAALKSRAATIQGFAFERIGLAMPVNAIAVTNPSGDAARFAAAAAVAKATGKAVILVSEKPEVVAAALAQNQGCQAPALRRHGRHGRRPGQTGQGRRVPAGRPGHRPGGAGHPDGEDQGGGVRGHRPLARRRPTPGPR